MPASILYVITELDVGGAEKALFELVRRLDRRRFAAEVACLTGHGEVGAWLSDIHVPVHYLRMPGDGPMLRHALGALRRLRRLVRDLRPDIVHTVLFHANLLGRLAAWSGPFARRPIVVSSVRVAERRCRWHLLGDYLTHRLADCEVCVSDGVRRFTRRHARLPADRLRVIPNGVDLDRIDRVQPLDRTALGCAPDLPTLCFVGRLEPQKGPACLLYALARVEADCQLLLVGHGPQRAELEALARALRIDRRVHFLGWRPDSLAVTAASDLFVLPSLWEGMSNALMEAMALGTCVVTTDVEGTDELIDPDRTGYLARRGSAPDLAAAIDRALAAPAHRRRIGHAARQHIADHFTIEQTVQQYHALYQDLLARR